MSREVRTQAQPRRVSPRWSWHIRTVLGSWYGWALGGVALAALLWPAGSAEERRILRWFLARTEVYGPLGLMLMTNGLLLVKGRVDERWAASAPGLGRVFVERWAVAGAGFALLLGLFIVLGAVRAGECLPGVGPAATGGLAIGRVLLSAMVSAVLFSLPGALGHHLSGSHRGGWAVGLAIYLLTLSVASLWCPADAQHQLWLPFAGLSDAGPVPLVLSKAGYAALAGVLARLAWLALRVPEAMWRAD